MKLLILGAGGHGRVAGETALEMKNAAGEPLFDDIAFLDDNSPDAIGHLSDFERFFGDYRHAFVAFGNNGFRLEWMDKLRKVGFELPILKHPSAIVSKSAKIGEGSIVEAGAIINSGVEIGKGSIISIGTIIDHDSIIGSGCHIDCGAVVKSMCSVEDLRKVTSDEIIICNK